MEANRAVNVLAIDVGGTHVKILATGQEERRRFDSGPTLTPDAMVSAIKKLARGWKYDRVSMGYPGPVLHGRPVAEPSNLGKGWVGFDYRGAFGCPVKIVNDAAMQALGSYRGGKMERLIAALEPDDVVLGGGNVKRLKELPPGCRAGDNANAFQGGFRLWEQPASTRHQPDAAAAAADEGAAAMVTEGGGTRA
jgi:predicted NBD/HSP70 family sugar kinase